MYCMCHMTHIFIAGPVTQNGYILFGSAEVREHFFYLLFAFHACNINMKDINEGVSASDNPENWNITDRRNWFLLLIDPGRISFLSGQRSCIVYSPWWSCSWRRQVQRHLRMGCVTGRPAQAVRRKMRVSLRQSRVYYFRFLSLLFLSMGVQPPGDANMVKDMFKISIGQFCP